ncbi:hypothetical protein F4806DRAFT_119039 [Annulohypoxylon nitens]|nr:hypothetical protein F4806DRAFT_119039 [Annulohypoxylon nitens]
MKSCGCTLFYAFYPCGHQSSEWAYCSKAKAKNLLKCGHPKACSSYRAVEVEPDLEDTCGSTCLTQPYQCTSCGSPKQVGWKCSRCQAKRTKDSPVWEPCNCPNPDHDCAHFALGKKGNNAVCKPCLTGACALGAPPPRHKTPVLQWRCHRCSQDNSTPANNMKCGGPRGANGCGYTRCGKCRALFSCTCDCGCAFAFVEDGPQVCKWCLKSCAGKREATR